MRLTGPAGPLGKRDWELPGDFKTEASHTLELRVVGDLITTNMDGQKVAEVRDSALTAGHPVFSGHDLIIESFEYANLDPAGGPVATAPAAAPVAPPVAASSSAQPGEVLTFGGHRYQFLEGPFIKTEAAKMATSLGGHVVTITSAAEQAWIEGTFADLIGGPNKSGICRTAGSNPSASASPSWTTGEPWSYENWDEGFPKAPTKSDFVILAQKGRKCPWRIAAWSDKTNTIVEWDSDTPTKPASPIAAATQPGKPVDLLALVEVKRDAIKGLWGVAAGTVFSKISAGTALLEIAHTPPEEYDFEIEFTIGEGAPWTPSKSCLRAGSTSLRFTSRPSRGPVPSPTPRSPVSMDCAI